MKEKENMEENAGHTSGEEWETLEHLYKEHYNLLYNYGLKMVGVPETVEDIIQDIFLHIFQKGIGVVRNPRVYLLRSMQYAVYNYCMGKKEKIKIEDMPFAVADNDVQFLRIFGRDDREVQRWKKVLSLIHELPTQQRRVLYLFYVRGCSHKEIAEILDISSQTSMNVMNKVLKKLRAFVSDEELLAAALFFLLHPACL